MAQTPSIGRIVHFVGPESEGPDLKPTAALIADVLDDSGYVNLVRFTPDGRAVPWLNIPHSDHPKHGCWNWPPFVPPTK